MLAEDNEPNREIAEKTKNAGMNSHIAKPADVTKTLRTLADILN